MKLSERSVKIKELISGQVDMGTFGLVELELIEFDKELSELKKLRVGDVMRSASVDIVDSDIATIEALHDLLLDAHGYQLDFITLKRARELTWKMYEALYPKQG